MGHEESPAELMHERTEIQRALRELDGWYTERHRTFMSLQAYIEDGLRSGRITESQKPGIGKNYLTPRMIATLGVDYKQMLRGLLLLKVRTKQLRSRLATLDEILAVEKKTAD